MNVFSFGLIPTTFHRKFARFRYRAGDALIFTLPPLLDPSEHQIPSTISLRMFSLDAFNSSVISSSVNFLFHINAYARRDRPALPAPSLKDDDHLRDHSVGKLRLHCLKLVNLDTHAIKLLSSSRIPTAFHQMLARFWYRAGS